MFRTFTEQRPVLAFGLVFLIGVSPVAADNPQLDDSLLSQAEEQAKGQHWTRAEALARRYLQSNAESGDGHALLGLILFNREKWKESMGEYVEASKYRDLTASEIKTFALDCGELHLARDADKWLTRSLEMDPDDSKGWEALGHVEFTEQRYEEAIRSFQRSLALAPCGVSAETGIGLAREMLSRLDDAKAAYKTAIVWESSKPNDPTPFHGLGRVLVKQGRPREALPYLQQAVKLGPAAAQAHEDLGEAYSLLNQLAAAQTELEKAVQLAPKVSRFHFMLGQVYRRAGLMEKAKAELDLYASQVGTGSTPDVDPR
jgi:tetratricopeptide (TPR) repeat protein